MSLKRQISLLISAVIIILLIGNLMVTLTSAKQYFEQQLNARAYDAATSLALSMSNSQDMNDAVRQKRMMSVLFDRGFFQRIALQRVDGELVELQQHSNPDDITPSFFRDWLDLKVLPAKADVSAQWQRLGELTVLSHTEFAYRDLWQITKAELAWFFWTAAITLVLMHILLGWLFQPLKDVERQALDVCERKLYTLPTLPRSRELRRVVVAMNKMITKLQQIFQEQTAIIESLKAESYHDEVTQLLNRHGFDVRFEHYIEAPEGCSGTLLLIQIKDFTDFNQQYGRESGDELLNNCAVALNHWLHPYSSTIVARRAGADFSVFMPTSDALQAKELMNKCFNYLSATVLTPKGDTEFHLGAVFLQGHDVALGQAFSQADMALRQAQKQSQSSAHLYAEPDKEVEWNSGKWQQYLQQVLKDKNVELHYQPYISVNSDFKVPTYLEVFCRMRHEDKIISAARFWPMVERHQLTAEFDLMVVQIVLAQLSLVTDCQSQICINISPASIMSQNFHDQLVQVLQHYPEHCQYLCFEVSESSLKQVELSLERLIPRVAELSISFGVDQVGTGTSAFSYLQRLPLSYVKIDGSFNRGLSDAKDQKFFIRSMVQIAHGLDLNVLAEGVESEQDVSALHDILVDGFSGYFFSPPIAELKQALSWR